MESNTNSTKSKTFFESYRFFYDYRYTLVFILLTYIPRIIINLLWSYYNNRDAFILLVTYPMLYAWIPLCFIITYLIRYMINDLKDFCFGEKITQTESIFRTKADFIAWRKNLFGLITNNKILIPFGVICTLIVNYPLLRDLFITHERVLFGVNVFIDPILTFSYIISVIGWLIFYFFISIAFIIFLRILFSIYIIGKDEKKLRISNTIKKYEGRLKPKLDGEELDKGTITYYEFQSHTRHLGVYLFNFTFKIEENKFEFISNPF